MNANYKYFSWGRVILVSLIVGCTELMWTLYNTYVPIWLQAGNPVFDAGLDITTVGFGFGAFVTGIILTFDNIAGLFISPVVGFLSDTTRSRFGRRKPWIIFCAPFAILAFALLPIFILRIPPELSGQTRQLTPYLIPFLIAVVAMLLPLAIMRTPANVIVYDITPSKNRTMANAIASMIGSGTGILAAIVGAILFNINPGLPFWIGSGLSAIVISLVAVRVTEPVEREELPPEAQNVRFKDIFKGFLSLPKEDLRSLAFLYLSIFFSYLAFAQLQSFASSYGVFVLGMDVGSSGMIYATGGAAFLVAAIPTGFITKKLKRKPATLIGFVIFAIMGLLLYLFPSQALLWPLVGFGGFFWAFVWVNQDPMVMDSIDNDNVLGALGGLMSIARTLGYIAGPIIGGFVVEKLGNNYSNIWLVLMVGCILGALALLPTTKGEVRQ